MLSLNVPLPGRVLASVEAARPALDGFASVRERPTLVVKRFGAVDRAEADRIESEARLVLADARPVEARVIGVGTFEEPPAGPGPVGYLAVDSPGLEALHGRLVEAFGAVPGLEGDDYVPHVTLARGGDPRAVEALADLDVEPVSWTVRELRFFDAGRGTRVGRVSLSP